MLGVLVSRNEVLLMAAILALLTNPSEERFQQQLEYRLNRQGRHWLESKVLSHATTAVHRRMNFRFCSLILTEPEVAYHFFGIFNYWIPLPKLIRRRRFDY
ncbi:hypothetical protein SYNPS1DRAFT_30496 [Syncephalis pseudoplumigaleata]|uniref:Uncharacterized protein n=1 Tax=Syncephalis pseudoplumigaleata TaxID=1712513 RepID=A0A4V1J142_9FUNG|nr:hypothetical protein SYNPS1DRAFT_31780 [Syncephalis pseudoplumigaleata]RKP23749.1 hypothetical protein SYNPS1DRAFT_30496 [Syncephalis pseudoplumigaleata]|eukprot:RKP22614.1 hypothetical protein SYNPS1DRAFT_31780 [Syncephalis pseudoplumigaleata]